MSTGIEWTRGDDGSAGETWNPLVGCRKVSSGCAHCYAETMARRLAGMATADVAAGRNPGRKAAYLNVIQDGGWKGNVALVDEALTEPLHWKKPRRVFVNSMSDLFYGDEADRRACKSKGIPFVPVPFEFIDRVFAVMALTPQHTYQVLTKRPERMAKYFADRSWGDVIGWVRRTFDEIGRRLHEVYTTDEQFSGTHAVADISPTLQEHHRPPQLPQAWPLPNVWLGCSVENQQTADERIPHLLRCPAAVRFLSVEPMLGPVDIGKYIGYNPMYENTTQRGGSLRGGSIGAASDRSERLRMEGCRTSRQPVESHGINEGRQAKARGESDGPLHAGAVDEGRSSDSLSRPQTGVAPFSRPDSERVSRQSPERRQAGQSDRESGVGDSEREQEAFVSHGHVGRARPEEPGGEADRFSGCGDSDDVSVRNQDPETDRKPVQGVASSSVEDCSRRSSTETERSDSRLHSEPGEGRRQALISWTICGGESGHGARMLNVRWIRDIISQCRQAGVPVFVKQLGALPFDHSDPRAKIDRANGMKSRLFLRDKKGGDPSEWPADLRVREFPTTEPAPC